MIAALVAALAIPTAHEHTTLAKNKGVPKYGTKVTTASNSCGWSFDYTSYANSMTEDLYVTLDGATAEGTLAAFIGGELHALVEGASGPPFGPYAFKTYYPTMVYDDSSGGAITYKLCVGGTTYESYTTSNSAVETFTTNAHYGSVLAPVLLEFTSASGPVDTDPSCAAYVEAGFTCPVMGSYACAYCAATCAAFC